MCEHACITTFSVPVVVMNTCKVAQLLEYRRIRLICQVGFATERPRLVVCLTRTMTLFASQSLLIVLVFNVFLSASASTKYYLTRYDIKKRMDNDKSAGGAKDLIVPLSSNVYYVEEPHETHEYGPSVSHYSFGDRKYSKFLSEEGNFVIVVVTLAVLLSCLS